METAEPTEAVDDTRLGLGLRGLRELGTLRGLQGAEGAEGARAGGCKPLLHAFRSGAAQPPSAWIWCR